MVVSHHVNDKLQWVNCSSTQTTRLTSLLFLADVGSEVDTPISIKVAPVNHVS